MYLHVHILYYKFQRVKCVVFINLDTFLGSSVVFALERFYCLTVSQSVPGSCRTAGTICFGEVSKWNMVLVGSVNTWWREEGGREGGRFAIALNFSLVHYREVISLSQRLLMYH